MILDVLAAGVIGVRFGLGPSCLAKMSARIAKTRVILCERRELEQIGQRHWFMMVYDGSCHVHTISMPKSL